MNLDQLRARWLDLMRRELPAAAAGRPEWPIRFDHCFGRVILDNICGQVWRDVVRAPAWRNLDEARLRAAIDLAEGVLDGSADLLALNARSLTWRRQKLRQTASTGPCSTGELRPATLPRQPA